MGLCRTAPPDRPNRTRRIADLTRKARSMSTTPLFDSISRHHERPVAVRATVTPAPTSPTTAPVASAHSALVPAALVAAIDDIPARIGAALPKEHTVCAEQLVLVEAVADAITRAVVDAVVTELDRIVTDGVVRS
jgi:hypothetical protein